MHTFAAVVFSASLSLGLSREREMKEFENLCVCREEAKEERFLNYKRKISRFFNGIVY
jgi:hypothetical protein